MLEQTLTKGERSLVEKGRSERGLVIRYEFREAMREECNTKVAELTGRRVIAMMSANHIEPDLRRGDLRTRRTAWQRFRVIGYEHMFV